MYIYKPNISQQTVFLLELWRSAHTVRSLPLSNDPYPFRPHPMLTHHFIMLEIILFNTSVLHVVRFPNQNYVRITFLLLTLTTCPSHGNV